MESDEESSSKDMPFYLKFLKKRIGKYVKSIWIVDCGIGDYEHFWITTSLRGFLKCHLSI